MFSWLSSWIDFCMKKNEQNKIYINPYRQVRKVDVTHPDAKDGICSENSVAAAYWKPQPFTVKSAGSKGAGKDSLTATVFIRFGYGLPVSVAPGHMILLIFSEEYQLMATAVSDPTSHGTWEPWKKLSPTILPATLQVKMVEHTNQIRTKPALFIFMISQGNRISSITGWIHALTVTGWGYKLPNKGGVHKMKIVNWDCHNWWALSQAFTDCLWYRLFITGVNKWTSTGTVLY